MTYELTGNIPPEVKEWLPFKPQIPIRITEIPHCVKLLNWHPVDRGKGHYGYDLAAYLAETASGLEVVIGLPKSLPVYAIAEGRVERIENNLSDPTDMYQTQITLKHILRGMRGRLKKPLYSDYRHVIPEVKEDQIVHAGQKIGTLFTDTKWENVRGRLVHLHILTRNGSLPSGFVDPSLIIPDINGPRCIPPEEISNFQIEGYGSLPIRIAHYQNLWIRQTEGR